jgi:signal transduction histidine kinase/DNA-binding response OmpR family regulator
MLILVSIWMWVGFLVTVNMAPITFLRTFMAVFVAQLGPVVGLVLLRKGRYEAATLCYLGGTWIWATSSALASGGIHASGVLLYVTLPASAAWLLGQRAALRMAAISVVSTMAFGILEMLRGVPPPPFRNTVLGFWFVAVQAILICTIPVGQVIQRLREALSEVEGYKDHLEQLVSQRTAELVQARDEAQAANRAKSVFLANMSHELRTPLNAILGFSNLLQEHDVTETQRQDLETINRSGEHLLTLINDVLDVAKIEAGRADLEIAPCDLCKVVEDATNMIRARASQKGLSLEVEAPPNSVFIWIDAARLRQVMINLLNNAVKFTHEGSVTLRVNTSSLNNAGDALLALEVEDTGEGISAHDQPLIFDPFFQAYTAKRSDGAGLGLTITRQIIEMMGGTIRVESVVGKGSRFHVEIPVQKALESDTRRGPNFGQVVAVAGGQPEYRILIAEDREENWIVLQRLLKNAGFHVRVAQNGADAVKEFLEWRPQFIWMDLRMPFMDGIEATRIIRESEGGREVKIAAVTASGFASERSEILAKGVDDYVRKPYRPAEIFECMARHLGVRYQIRGSAAKDHTVTRDLTAADLSVLSETLREELRESLLTLDQAKISAAITHVAQENAEIGSILRRHADNYAYTKVLAGLEDSGGSLPVAEVH